MADDEQFYRPAKVNEPRFTTAELCERLALTAKIVANLRTIRTESADLDLDKLAKQTFDILRNVRETGADEVVRELKAER